METSKELRAPEFPYAYSGFYNVGMVYPELEHVTQYPERDIFCHNPCLVMSVDMVDQFYAPYWGLF